MMKQSILMACLSLCMGMQVLKAQQKEFKETIKKEIPFSNSTDNTLIVKNVFGSVVVEGYDGNKLVVVVEKTIRADNSQDLELGKKELGLQVVSRNNKVFLHPDAPYMNFDKNQLKYNWCNDYQDLSYEHLMNFKIRVPHSVQLNVGTVNEGEVTVKNTNGTYLEAKNVNGGITLSNVTGKTKVNCINGTVNISYTENPKSSSKYYSLNGDINISYQKALSVNISFKSMNGEMFTDFDIDKQFMKTNKEKSGRAKYKFESKPVVQIGNGQIDFDFETLNGNVFIKKI